MRAFISNLLVALFLISCSLLEPSVEIFYFSESKAKKITRENYSRLDTLYVPYFLFDSKTGRYIDKFKCFPIDTAEVVNYFRNSFGQQDLNIQFSSSLDIFSFSEVKYYDIRTMYILPKLQKRGYDRDRFNLALYFYLKVFYDSHREAGWGGYPVPTSNNIYLIVQVLDMYVVHMDSTYYSYSYLHSDTLIQDNRIPFAFSFQPEVVDSLISLTIHEFKQRLR